MKRGLRERKSFRMQLCNNSQYARTEVLHVPTLPLLYSGRVLRRTLPLSLCVVSLHSSINFTSLSLPWYDYGLPPLRWCDTQLGPSSFKSESRIRLGTLLGLFIPLLVGWLVGTGWCRPWPTHSFSIEALSLSHTHSTEWGGWQKWLQKLGRLRTAFAMDFQSAVGKTQRRVPLLLSA